MFCIVLADRPHGSCKRTFLKTGFRVEKLKNAALVFSFGQRICILLHIDDAIAPLLDLWTLRRLMTTTTTTTTMADFMFVSVLRKILSRSSSSTSLPHKRFWFPLTSTSSCYVWFLLLLSVCILRTSFMLRLFISSATCRPGIWTTACWVF